MSITLWQYYVNLAHKLAERAFEGIETLADWEAQRPRRLREFMLSVGLDPLPPRCDLRTQEMGEVAGEGYRITKLAFQILPDCWATAGLFLPEPLPARRLPALLYVAGHAGIGPVGYQGHGIMWARRGYACLILDTVEQHDNPGDHHGTYYDARRDWISMGYSAAGGELWNSIRALDLLCGLPMVDADRIGCTGNSGGGALSFYMGIADERVKAVASACGVTVAGFTLEHRHLMHHCDCMYPHNRFQRDASEFAALIAPRPVLFCFAREDILFSPAEFRGLVERTQRIYRLYGRGQACRLFESEGPHGYRPQTVEAINAWFDEHVAGKPHPKADCAEHEHSERELTVFNGLPPQPNHLALLPELLTPVGSFGLPQGPDDWPTLRDAAVARVRREVLGALDRMDEPFEVETLGEWLSGRQRWVDYRARVGGMDVWIEMLTASEPCDTLVVGLADADMNVHRLMRVLGGMAGRADLVGIEPRGTGFSGARDGQTNFLLRAAALVGVTPTALMIKDLLDTLAFLRAQPDLASRRTILYGRGDAGVACLYAALLDASVGGVVLDGVPDSHRSGGYLLGVLRLLDIDQAIGLMGPRPVGIVAARHLRLSWARRLYARLGCSERLRTASNAAALFERVLEAVRTTPS